MICFTPITQFVNQLCYEIFGAGFTLDTLICYAVLAGMILLSLKQLHFQLITDALLMIVLFAVAFALSYSADTYNQRYMFTDWDDFAGNPAYLLFVFSLPAYVFMRYITDYDRMFDICRVFSLINIFCSLGSFILMFSRNTQPEYMSFSYSILFAAIFSSVHFFERKKILSLIVAILGIVMIFLAGARGPLVCYLFSLVAYFLLSKASAAKKILTVFFLLAVSLIIMLLWQEILLGLKNLVDSIGLSSRTIDILIEGDFFSDSGRGEIQQRIIESFSLFGRGLYGDRVVGGDHYAHNLIIELLSQWGFLLGTLIIVTLGVLFIKGFRTKNISLKMLILVLFSSSVVKLMFSESYLAHNAGFFALIAACVNAITAKPAAGAAGAPEPARKKSKYIKIPGRYS